MAEINLKSNNTKQNMGVVSASSIRWLLASLSLSMLLSSLGTSITNVGLPTLVKTFSASFQQVQWVVLAYLLTISCLIVSVGRLGDITGRRRLLLAGIGLFTLASALCGIAPSLGWLIAARVVQGLGAAIMMSLTMAFVGETIPKEKTGSAMGLLGSMSAVGTALGPSLGGILIGTIGWPAIFWVNVPLGLLALILASVHLPADRQRAAQEVKPQFDIPGTFLLALTLGAYALAMTLGRGDFGLFNAVLLLVAMGGLVLFVIAESTVSSPLIRLELFRKPVLSAGFAMSALVTTVVMATLVVGPFYLHRALALDAAAVGLAMSTGPIVAAFLGVPSGRMVDRFGTHCMTITGLVGMAAGTSLLPVLPIGWGVVGYILPLVITTAGYALFQAANNTAVMSSIGADQRGVVAGMLNLSRNLGLITGASVMGALFAVATAAPNVLTASVEAVATGMHLTFAVAAALIFAAIAMALISQSVSRRSVSHQCERKGSCERN